MKSRKVRDEWKQVLADVQNGEEIVVELYNRPVARIIPYKEAPMPTITAADIRDLANADFADLAVLCIDTDGDLWICPESTAREHGARIITDATAVADYTGGIQDEHTSELHAALADELNNELSR